MTFLILKMRSHEQIDVRGSYRIVFQKYRFRISAWSSTILAEFLLGFLGTSRKILLRYVDNLPLLPSKSFRVRY